MAWRFANNRVGQRPTREMVRQQHINSWARNFGVGAEYDQQAIDTFFREWSTNRQRIYRQSTAQYDGVEQLKFYALNTMIQASNFCRRNNFEGPFSMIGIFTPGSTTRNQAREIIRERVEVHNIRTWEQYLEEAISDNPNQAERDDDDNQTPPPSDDDNSLPPTPDSTPPSSDDETETDETRSPPQSEDEGDYVLPVIKKLKKTRNYLQFRMIRTNQLIEIYNAGATVCSTLNNYLQDAETEDETT